MATAVSIGYGSSFAIGDGGGPETFSDVAEVVSITPPSLKADTVDATHMASPEAWREFVPGLLDPGECSITLNWVPGSAAETALLTFLTGRATKNCRITFPNSETWTFAAFCTAYTPEDPLDAKMSATAQFKLSGKPTFAS